MEQSGLHLLYYDMRRSHNLLCTQNLNFAWTEDLQQIVCVVNTLLLALGARSRGGHTAYVYWSAQYAPFTCTASTARPFLINWTDPCLAEHHDVARIWFFVSFGSGCEARQTAEEMSTKCGGIYAVIWALSVTRNDMFFTACVLCLVGTNIHALAKP